MQEGEEFFERMQFPLLVTWPRVQGKNSITHTRISVFVSMQQSKIFLWTLPRGCGIPFFPPVPCTVVLQSAAYSHTLRYLVGRLWAQPEQY